MESSRGKGGCTGGTWRRRCRGSTSGTPPPPPGRSGWSGSACWRWPRCRRRWWWGSRAPTMSCWARTSCWWGCNQTFGENYLLRNPVHILERNSRLADRRVLDLIWTRRSLLPCLLFSLPPAIEISRAVVICRYPSCIVRKPLMSDVWNVNRNIITKHFPLPPPSSHR